jgi:hypothetical protein
MKKHLLLLPLALISIITSSQVSIPNGDLETWTSGISDFPQYYPYTSNNQNFFVYKLPFNVEKSTDAYHGVYAVKVFTNASATDTSGGYFVNSPNTDGPSWHGGVPYAQVPKGVRGYYKCNIATEDTALLIAAFSKGGSNIGMYFLKLSGVKTSYTLFNFTFNPLLSQTPDSVMLGVTSSNMLAIKQIPGSTLTIDSVSFTGGVSQPALLNGDFESWQSETLYRPFGLYTQEKGTKRTTDAYAGSYAAELSTFSGYEKNVPSARSAQISTGYYVNSCSCMKGGYPFSNKKDTLVFYYKYTPTIATDSATITLNFKKNGSSVFVTGKNLGATAIYKYVEVPFDMSTTPDSVIMDIRSSYWSNKALSYVGAVLKIDEINFKSELLPTSIKSFSKDESINIYPNPSDGKFTIQIAESKMLPAKGRIEIFNEVGKSVYRAEIKDQKSNVDISAMSNGIYFVKIYYGSVVHTEKIVKR